MEPAGPGTGVVGAAKTKAGAEGTAEAEAKAEVGRDAETKAEADGAAETKAEADGAAETRVETIGVAEAINGNEAATGGNSTCPPVELPPGGGCPGVASPVPSGLNPPARVHSFLPDAAPGSRGGWSFVLGLSWCGASEVRGGAPNAMGGVRTVVEAAGVAWAEDGAAVAAKTRGEAAGAAGTNGSAA